MYIFLYTQQLSPTRVQEFSYRFPITTDFRDFRVVEVDPGLFGRVVKEERVVHSIVTYDSNQCELSYGARVDAMLKNIC